MPEVFPRLGWASVLDDATLSANPTDFAAESAVVNIRDGRAWSFWQPLPAGPVELIADLPGPRTTTYAALAGHDAAGAITVEIWTGTAWQTVATTTADGSGAVRYLTWPPAVTTRLRFRFDHLSFLSTLLAGEDLILPEGLAPGWSDPDLAQRPKLNAEISRGGVWLGARVEFWDATLTLNLKRLTPGWVRTYWRPFQRACATRPFVLHWHQTDWPDSACLCTNADFGESAFSTNGFIDVSVSFTAELGRRGTP